MRAESAAGHRAKATAALRALLRMRFRMLLHPAPVKGRGVISRRRGIPVWLRYVALLIVIEIVSFTLAAQLNDAVGGSAGRVLLTTLLTLVASSGTALLFLMAIPNVLSMYTYNSDLRLLLLTPLSPRLLMAEKFISLYLRLSALLVLIGVPVLLGMGIAAGLGPVYLVVALLVLVLLPITPVAVAQILLTLVLRWLPPRLARTVTVVLSTSMAIATYIGSQVLSANAGHGSANLRQFIAGSSSSWWQDLPTAWPGRALAATADGHAGTAIGYLAATAGLAAILGSLAIVFTAYLFTTGWATYQEVGRRRRPRAAGMGARQATAAAPALAAVVPSVHINAGRLPRPRTLREVWRPLWRKEWHSLLRDPQVWARMAYPLVIVIFGLYRSFATSDQSRGAAVGALVTTLGLSIFFLCVGFLALRIVNREGHSLYLLAMSPIAVRDILLVKWAFCVAPVLVLGEAIVIVGAVGLAIGFWQTVLSMLVVSFLVVALDGLLIVLSLIWPRLDWDGPNRQASGAASTAGSLAGLLLTAGSGALTVIAFIVASDHVLWAVAALGGVLVVNAGIGVASLVLGTRLLGRLLQNS